MHYGVMGQKWGIRRYQNSDGTLTEAGKARYGENYSLTSSDKKQLKSEVKSDNKQAYSLGRSATILGRASADSIKRLSKMTKKVDDKVYKDGSIDPNSKTYKKFVAASNTALKIAGEYAKVREEAQNHCQSLVDKYGDDSVNRITYSNAKISKTGSIEVINENVNNGKSFVSAAVRSVVASTLITAIALPTVGYVGGVVYRPTTKNEKGKAVSKTIYKQELKKNKTTVDGYDDKNE